MNDDVPSPSFSLFLSLSFSDRERERTDRNVTRHSGSLYIPRSYRGIDASSDCRSQRTETRNGLALRPRAAYRPVPLGIRYPARTGRCHVPSGGHTRYHISRPHGPRVSRLSAHPLNGLTHLTEKTHRRLTVAWRPTPRASNENF